MPDLPEHLDFVVTYHTGDFRGDHCVDVEIAVAVDPGMTVQRMVDTLMATECTFIKPGSSYIMTRRVVRHV